MDEYTRELVYERARKAAATVSSDIAPGGVMLSTQARTFFEKAILSSPLLSMIRTEIMPSPTHEVPKLGLGTRLMEKAAETVAATGTKPTFSKITLSAKEIIGEIDLSKYVLEDNIEKDGFADRLVNLMARAAGRDLHELVIKAGTNGADTYLTTLDPKGGVIQQLNGGNIANANGDVLGGTVFKQALQTMPEEWRTDDDSVKFFVSRNQVLEYREALAKRMTGLGDALVTGRGAVYAYGTEIVGISHMPQTTALLINPQNIILGIHREVTIETDYDVQTRVWMIVISMRVDVQIEETEAAVRIDNIAAPLVV